MKEVKAKQPLSEGTNEFKQGFGEAPKRRHSRRITRRLNEPKPEHLFVLEALKVANLALNRAASTTEIVQALAPKELAALTQAFQSPLERIILNSLSVFLMRKIVFIVRGHKGKKYYGASEICSPETTLSPDGPQSRRGRVLRLVKEAVKVHNRALRLKEILDFVDGLAEYRDLTPKLISLAVLSLKDKGELKIVGVVRGDGKGCNLYLPSELCSESYLPSEPATWLEYVMTVFRVIWQEHLVRAERDGCKPLPITTGEVRMRMLELGEFAEKLKEVWVTANALQQLSVGRRASIRGIKRQKQMALFWIPIQVNPSEVEVKDAYANDGERIGEAVKRAGIRWGRPVNLQEVEKEVIADLSIQLNSPSKLRYSLRLEARETIGGGARKTKRVLWRVYRIGSLNSKPYYYHQKTIEAEAYVKYRQLEADWSNLKPDEQLTTIGDCGSETVAVGRIKLLAQEVAAVSSRLEELRKIENILGISDLDIDSFTSHVHGLITKINEWKEELERKFPYLPQTTNNFIAGWTAHELIDNVRMFYPSARSLSINKCNIQSLIGKAIRRIPNPHFTTNIDQNSRLAAVSLYDETDAKIYIAKQWGGAECHLQAVLAANELGLLRDSRFVVPALESKDYNLRLSAIACLAFLPSESGNSRLREVAVNDEDAGVRQSALWAYGFAGGENAIDFIEERASQDRNERVRRFVREMLEGCNESWFLF